VDDVFAPVPVLVAAPLVPVAAAPAAPVEAPAVAAAPEVTGVPPAAGVAEAPAATDPVPGVPASAPAVALPGAVAKGVAPLVAATVTPGVTADCATGPVSSGGADCLPTTPWAITATKISGTSPIAGTSHHQRQTGAAAPRREWTA
jgi:hypothetical protein